MKFSQNNHENLRKTLGERYCFDLDGTLCLTIDGKYETAKPFVERIKIVNELYDSGAFIIIFTARGTKTGINHYSLTSSQLKLWNIKYDELILGKPEATLYVDDRAINSEVFFKNVKDL